MWKNETGKLTGSPPLSSDDITLTQTEQRTGLAVGGEGRREVRGVAKGGGEGREGRRGGEGRGGDDGIYVVSLRTILHIII